MTHRILRFAAAALLAVAAAACDSPTTAGEAERALVGEWVGPRFHSDGLSGRPRYAQATLYLGKDGTYRDEWRELGAQGRPDGETTRLSTVSGRFRVVGDEMEFTPAFFTFYEYNAIDPVDSKRFGGPTYRWRMRVLDDEIEFRYLTYETDAPMESTVRYQRMVSID